MTIFFALLVSLKFLCGANSLKTWIPNTNVNNKLNWDKKDIPKDCDNIYFHAETEVATYWNLKKVTITGLSLPETGNIIFPNNIKIQFRDKKNCSDIRELKFIRLRVKGWLDPENWMSDSEFKWLPHIERVPCAGEPILFLPQSTFAVQLPSILLPIGEIRFDNEVFRGDTWSDFLKTELGFQFFKGTEDIRNMPWRNDVGCSDGKKCFCGRSSYSMRDRLYRETEPYIYKEAVCLYAKPKCKISACYSPVVPEGHCCGICGAVIKIEDKTKEKLNISIIKAKVQKELGEFQYEHNLKTYVGRAEDGSIQIVVVAESSDDTIKSHIFANIMNKKLNDQQLHVRITSQVSGLKISDYLLNSVSGVVFGTLLAILMLFAGLFFIYVILPKKKFHSLNADNPFMFARFENILNNENLEIGSERETQEGLSQAFDNPMYSGNTEIKKESKKVISSDSTKFKVSENSKTLGAVKTKEYSNPIYSELEKTKQLDALHEASRDNSNEFKEINV